MYVLCLVVGTVGTSALNIDKLIQVMDEFLLETDCSDLQIT